MTRKETLEVSRRAPGPSPEPVHGRVLCLDQWESPATAYPLKRVGHAEVSTFDYARGTYPMFGVAGYQYFQVTRRLRIRNLKISGRVWMVDDPPHWYAMCEHAAHFNGHVVCAGLGLGLIVHALAKYPGVKRITVVERNADVIRLVRPHIPDCEIVHDDFWNWRGEPDGVLYDLFTGSGREQADKAIRAMIELSERFPVAKTIRIHGFNNDFLTMLRACLCPGEKGFKKFCETYHEITRRRVFGDLRP